jgi:hypothetical protein
VHPLKQSIESPASALLLAAPTKGCFLSLSSSPDRHLLRLGLFHWRQSSVAMRFVSALFPRNLCLSISNGAYLAIVLTPTAICLLLTFISIYYEVWDVTVYDAAALPFIKQSSNNPPTNIGNSSSSLSGVLAAESSVFQVFDDNAVVFDSRGSCDSTPSGLNGTFLTEERGGVWRLYRVFTGELPPSPNGIVETFGIL